MDRRYGCQFEAIRIRSRRRRPRPSAAVPRSTSLRAINARRFGVNAPRTVSRRPSSRSLATDLREPHFFNRCLNNHGKRSGSAIALPIPSTCLSVGYSWYRTSEPLVLSAATNWRDCSTGTTSSSAPLPLYLWLLGGTKRRTKTSVRPDSFDWYATQRPSGRTRHCAQRMGSSPTPTASFPPPSVQPICPHLSAGPGLCTGGIGRLPTCHWAA